MKLPPNTKTYLWDINYKTIVISDVINFIKKLVYFKQINQNFSLYNNNRINIRNSYNNSNDWDKIYLEEDIFFLKLWKLWLVNIELFDITKDIETIEWKNYYSFINKYYIANWNYSNSDTWATKYDIYKILENDDEYEEFIKHIYLNVFPDDKVDEYFDYYDDLENRIMMSVQMPSIKDFFESMSKIFVKKKTNIYLQNKLIKIYESDNDYIEFKIDDYFKWYSLIYSLLIHLENKWILKIKDIIFYTKLSKDKKTWFYYIKFIIDKISRNILPIFLEWFIIPIIKEKFKLYDDWKLTYSNWIVKTLSFKINDGSFILLKKLYSTSIDEWFDLFEYFDEYENTNLNSDYKKFKKNIWEDIKNINRRIKDEFNIKTYVFKWDNEKIYRKL